MPPTQNPGNEEHLPPGRNPAPISVSGSVSIPEEEINKRNTPFSVVTIAPPSLIAGAQDCPNSSWEEEIQDLLFTFATIKVEQPMGNVVLVVSCTTIPPSENGAIPGVTSSALEASPDLGR